jgi:acyl carrier protein
MTQATSTTASRTERMRQLADIVTEVLELEPGELTETGSFVDDYSADSLMAIEILARIERDLGVSLAQDDLPEMTNLAAVYSVVARHAGWEDGDG